MDYIHEKQKKIGDEIINLVNLYNDECFSNLDVLILQILDISFKRLHLLTLKYFVKPCCHTSSSNILSAI